MNCHAVQQLLSAERDETLGADSRGELDTHLAGCATCRQLRATWAEAAESWRTTTAGVRVPDGRMCPSSKKCVGSHATQPARGIFTLWRSATLGAVAAAVALGLFLAPAWVRGPQAPTATLASASVNADSVEIGGEASSAMVFVDDKSGWLVVWAADGAEKVGS